jgi:hypothetical protein
MNRLILLFFVCALTVSCGAGGERGGEVVVFDYKANYPQSELTLADVADVEFIRIGKSDDFLMAGRVNAKAGETYVSDKFILKKDNDQLFMFDRQGNPIRKIGIPGRGPNEYPYLQYFVGVDEALSEVYIYGGTQKLLVYGLDGGFKRAIDTETPGFLSGMELLNDTEIICLDNMRGGGFYTISREDGKRLRDIPVTFSLPYAHDPNGRMAYPNIFRNANGTTLFELRTDTIHRITPRGELVPTIVDVLTAGPPHDAGAFFVELSARAQQY